MKKFNALILSKIGYYTNLNRNSLPMLKKVQEQENISVTWYPIFVENECYLVFCVVDYETKDLKQARVILDFNDYRLMYNYTCVVVKSDFSSFKSSDYELLSRIIDFRVDYYVIDMDPIIECA